MLMKLLLNFSPPTAYDQLAALRDSGAGLTSDDLVAPLAAASVRQSS